MTRLQKKKWTNIGGSESGITSALLCLTKQKDADDHSIIDKSYLHVKDPIESKY